MKYLLENEAMDKPDFEKFLKGLFILLALLSLAACSPYRYRVLIINKTNEPVDAAIHLYKDPKTIADKDFDELFKTGKIDRWRYGAIGTSLHIGRPENTINDYFWIGIIGSKSGQKWVLNQKFEDYGRWWLDFISEGLRIDYFIEPDGEIKKDYWK